MSTEEGTYAPKSPDLSSFFSGGHDPNAGGGASFTSAPNPNSLSGYSPSSTYNSSSQQQQQQYQHQPGGHYAQAGQPQPHQTYSSPATYNNYNSTYTAPSPTSARSQQPYFSSPPPPPPTNLYAQLSQPAYILSPQQQHNSPPSLTGPQPYYSTFTEDPSNHYLPPQPQVQQSAQLQSPRFPPAYDQQQPQLPAEPLAAMPPRKSAAAQAQQPEIMHSPVKTKFPTARIKRIMQADEEVGKVAQQTPIAVGKALELFMVQIVGKSADVAKDKNSKRITAQMLKQAVEGNPQWDFLQEIVAKVSEKEEKEPKGKKASENTDSDEDLDVEPKKKGRGGRKKKAAS
ncbi:NADH-cytochrome b5 reductase [Pestalotiopsis sp. IQ-011]